MQLQQQRHTYRLVFLLAAGALMGGCASRGNIQSDYDHDADFGAYKTFNFIEGAGVGAGSHQSLFSRYMIDAITLEMRKRGYTMSDDPDLLVNFNAVFQEKMKVTTTPASPSMMTGYYGYRRGYYGGWGTSYHYAQETHVSQYTQGTFNIDLVDNARKQLVWEAVGVGRISQKQLNNLEAGVHRGVPRFFGFYPFLAGNPNPVATK